jgi:hypothetical protein
MGYGGYYVSYVLRSHGKKVWVSKDRAAVWGLDEKAQRRRQEKCRVRKMRHGGISLKHITLVFSSVHE